MTTERAQLLRPVGLELVEPALELDEALGPLKGLFDADLLDYTTVLNGRTGKRTLYRWQDESGAVRYGVEVPEEYKDSAIVVLPGD